MCVHACVRVSVCVCVRVPVRVRVCVYVCDCMVVQIVDLHVTFKYLCVVPTHGVIIVAMVQVCIKGVHVSVGYMLL